MLHDDKENMTAVEFMQKSLEVLQEKMTRVEDMIDQTRDIIDSQDNKLKGQIKGITQDFVKNYIMKSMDLELKN